MKPVKKKKANVKEILKNPVKSEKQKPLQYKREGFWGWMSYVGWMLGIILPLAGILADRLHLLDERIAFVFGLPNIALFEIGIVLIAFFGIGVSLIIFLKSPYTKKKLNYIVAFLPLFVLLMLVLDIFSSEEAFVSILSCYILLFLYYLYYFYKKSKNGYKHVWLKLFLFTLFPFIPLVFMGKIQNPVYDEGGIVMGHTLATDPGEWGEWVEIQ